MTPLDRTLKRIVKIKRSEYVITLSPAGLKLTRKGRRRGLELRWESLVNGESALAVALQASIGTFEADGPDNSLGAGRTPTKRPRSTVRRK